MLPAFVVRDDAGPVPGIESNPNLSDDPTINKVIRRSFGVLREVKAKFEAAKTHQKTRQRYEFAGK